LERGRTAKQPAELATTGQAGFAVAPSSLDHRLRVLDQQVDPAARKSNIGAARAAFVARGEAIQSDRDVSLRSAVPERAAGESALSH
jgi:hypothetical protein